MRVALVYEWYTAYSGAERVNEQILALFPDADLYALVDFLPAGERNFIQNKPVVTSFLQKMPFAKKHFRKYLPLMPFAIEQFDMSPYDVVISSNHAVAKGVITGPNQLHICYCHSPVRYAWDLQHQYLKQANLERGLKSLWARYSLHKLRQWDYQSGARPDYYVANSQFIANRIRKVYRRDATVIAPPVDVDGFALQTQKQDYYCTSGRMVPYKRFDVIVNAFRAMPDKHLKVLGAGSDFDMVKACAQGAPNIEFLGYGTQQQVQEVVGNAKAFVFAAEEDFGIAPVEAQAAGTPVIAFGRGGALETVDASGKHPTGVFFGAQTAEAVQEAVLRFEASVFDAKACRKNALRFSAERFQQEFAAFVNAKKSEFFGT